MTQIPTHPDLLRGVNLYLIGMMGAGKSTLGQRIAQAMGYRFMDTDALVEKTTGQSIPALFATSGEAAFRDLEAAILRELTPYKGLVVATGGGIVLRQENWGHLHQGVVVWVDAPLSVLEQRLGNDTERPLLQRPDWRDHLATLLAQRQRRYQEADIHLPVAPGESVTATCDRLLTLLQARILPPAGQPQ